MTENDVIALAIAATAVVKLTALGLSHVRTQRAAERKAATANTNSILRNTESSKP